MSWGEGVSVESTHDRWAETLLQRNIFWGAELVHRSVVLLEAFFFLAVLT